MNSTPNSPKVTSRSRKREIDNDSAGSSGSSATGIDSMRPVVAPRRRRKKRRTFLDAFNSITLQKNKKYAASSADSEEDDADSSQAVAEGERYSEEDDSDNGSSLLGDDLDDDEDQGSMVDDHLLSDKEETERKVMFELVFGPNSEHALQPRSLVDLRLTEMIRHSMQQAAAKGIESRDDMNIDAPYSRSSGDLDQRPTLKRTNSLPELFTAGNLFHSQDDTEMGESSSTNQA